MITSNPSPRRPGRPKSEEKAAAIREAAGQLFMVDGIERTTVDAIAQAAGVSKQTVYSHFHSKDDLFRECVRCKVHDYGLQDSEIDPQTDIETKLQAAGRRFLTLISDPEVIRMFRLMIAEATTFPRVSESFHESGPLATLDFMSHIFAAHLPAGDRELARDAAVAFTALLEGEFLLEMLLGAREGIDEKAIEQRVTRAASQIQKLYPLSEKGLR